MKPAVAVTFYRRITDNGKLFIDFDCGAPGCDGGTFSIPANVLPSGDTVMKAGRYPCSKCTWHMRVFGTEGELKAWREK